MIDEKKSIFDLADKFGMESPFGNDWVKKDFKETVANKTRIVSISVIETGRKSFITIPNSNKTLLEVLVLAKIEGEENVSITVSCDGGAKAQGNIQINNKKRDNKTGILSYEVSKVFYIYFDRNTLQPKSYITVVEITSSGKIEDKNESSFTVDANGVISEGKTENLECLCKKNLTLDEVKNIVKTLRENTYYSATNPSNGKKENFPLTKLPYYSIDKIFHRNNTSGKYKNEEVSNNSFENFTAQLNKVFEKYEINNCKRRAHFLSQVYIETQFFSQTIESDNNYTSKYDPYRGRGFIHLTHDFNYKSYEEYCRYNVLDNYSLVATNLEIAADSAGWFWNLGSGYRDINKIADTKSVKEVTKAVNGGDNGLVSRQTAYNLLIKIFNEKDC